MNNKNSLQVILGSQTIKAFVAAPKEFKVIGIVRMGMEFGLLALNSAGVYLRVNGSIFQNLKQAEVEAAIAKTMATGRGRPFLSDPPVKSSSPVITFRKHRKPVRYPRQLSVSDEVEYS